MSLEDAIVQLVEDGIAAGIAALDPEERKRTVRELVQREASKWAALDPGLLSKRADEITARHHVEREDAK